MKVMEYVFPPVHSRSDTFTLYPLGDVHIGAFNCAEKQFRSVVNMIEEDPNARWFGGGDLVDAVILQDQKRFDPNVLPNWLLADHKDRIVALIAESDLEPEDAADEIIKLMSRSTREKLADMVSAQRKRLLKIVDPIKDKCIGLMEGNHEYTIMKYHNRDLMTEMCAALAVPHLTDCCFVRFKFTRVKGKPKGRKRSLADSACIRMFALHGNGGGRTPGAEPNNLARLAGDKVCELVLRGHSHTQFIMPPIARLTIPTGGALDEEAESTILRAANWGCYLRTYAAGPSTYDSRAQYPVRPLSTIKIRLTPFRDIGGRTRPKIKIEELEMTAR